MSPSGHHRPAHRTVVESITLHSHYVHEPMQVLRIVPARHGDWTLVLLHGRGHCHTCMRSPTLFDALQRLGNRAPVVLIPTGGDHSYWHNRADGDWGSMVLKDIVPRHGRVAIGGVSMGGYGALLLGSEGRFCAIGGHSPALWFSGGESAAGAFDDATDYARHDILNHPPRYSAPVWIDVGTEDPFHNAAVYYAHEIHAKLHVWPGAHGSAYWDAHLRRYLAFYARHCA